MAWSINKRLSDDGVYYSAQDDVTGMVAYGYSPEEASYMLGRINTYLEFSNQRHTYDKLSKADQSMSIREFMMFYDYLFNTVPSVSDHKFTGTN